MTDDPLARAFRALDTAQTDEDAPIPQTAERRLQEIVRARPHYQHTRRRSAYIVPGVIAASIAIMLAVVSSWMWWPSPAAQAQTPDPLSYSTSKEGVLNVIYAAKEHLASGDGVAQPQRRSVSEGWYFSGEPDANGPVLIRRERVDLLWEADLSGSVRTTIAAVTTSEGVVVDDPDAAAGSVIQELTFGPSEFNVVSVDAPAPNSDAMSVWLSADRGVVGELGAGDTILGIQSLLGQWTLTNAQQSALLDLLAQAPGARVVGTASDRLGRPVVGIAAIPDSNTDQEVTLLLALDTGKIVGFESTLRTEDKTLNLPAGSVTGYTLWEVDK